MGTREQILEAADRLFYEQGFEATSFASIADAVGISRGNFYHHFKTKDAILEAVIEMRLDHARATIATWGERAETPIDRIERFVEMMVSSQGDLERYGCPIGTLNSELAKRDHPLQAQAAGLFGVYRDWLRQQFDDLGQPDAEDLGLHVLAFSQGVAAMSHAFQDRTYVRREVDRLTSWLSQFTAAPARR